MKWLRGLIYAIGGVFTVLLALSAYLTFQLVSDDPLVVETGDISPRATLSLKDNLKQAISGLSSGKGSRKITLRHQELEELSAILSRSVPSVSTIYNYSDSQLLIAGSLKLPVNPIGKYLNISAEFSDAGNLFEGSTRIGRLRFDNGFLLGLSFLAGSLVFDKHFISEIRYILKSASYSNQGVSLTFDRAINTRLLKAEIKQNLFRLRNVVWNDSNFSGVEHYYNYLLNFSEYTKGIKQVSLFDYLKPLFIEARRQSTLQNPVEENINALIALGLFAGDYNLRKFLSHVVEVDLKASPQYSSIVLGGRKDLLLHFVYSAIIQIFSNRDTSISIGEIKELSDMDSNGSGFSFADLAADRAGIQFATMAMDNNGGASTIQSLLSKADSEQSFFPDIAGLQEQLSLLMFETEYQDTNSEAYRAIVHEIDRRIGLLALYSQKG